MGKKFYLLLAGIMMFEINIYAQSEIETKSTPKFSFETEVANKYAWRGILYDQGLETSELLVICHTELVEV